MDTISYLLGKKKGGGGGSNLQTKSVTITENGTSSVMPDEGYDGLTKVNLTTNVQPDLESKSITITENGTTNVTPTIGKDGLSEVSITTNVGGGGADLSDYFTDTIGAGTANNPAFAKMIKTIPSETTVQGTSLAYAFSEFTGTTIPLIDTSDVKEMSYIFQNCINITSIPQINTAKNTSMMGFCQGCTMLSQVPLLNTSAIPVARGFSNAFYGCPNLSDQSLDNILQMCINSRVSINAYANLKSVGFNATDYPVSRIQALPHYQDFINTGWTIGY